MHFCCQCSKSVHFTEATIDCMPRSLGVVGICTTASYPSWCHDACLSLVIRKGSGFASRQFNKDRQEEVSPAMTVACEQRIETDFCFCKTSRHPSCVVPGWVCKNFRLCQTKMLIFNKHITASLLQIAVSFNIAFCLPFRHDCAPFHDYYLDPLQQNRFVGTNIKL